MKTFVLLLGLVVPVMAFAAGGGGGGISRQETAPNLQEIKSRIDGKRYSEAIPLLKSYLGRNPNSADAYNYLGLCYRKTGNLPEAFKAYRKALAIDPRHLGAHEYLGEAYLMNKEPEKARATLEQLKKLCGTCGEYQDLEAALRAYRQ